MRKQERQGRKARELDEMSEMGWDEMENEEKK